LKKNPELIKKFIDNSKSTYDTQIKTLTGIKSEVLDLITNHKKLSGVTSNEFRWFNKTLKGLRKGEMTIWTGSTGSGKTTLLSQ